MKNTVLVSSIKDPAGTNICQNILDIGNFKETGNHFEDSPILSDGNGIFLANTTEEIVFVVGLDEKFAGMDDPSYVFLSRHKAESGIPSFTAHFTGNYGSNEFGGLPGELAFCDPSVLKNYFLELKSLGNEIPQKFKITVEATHHGPTSLQHPVLFVELGSGPQEWTEKEPGGVIAKALLNSLRTSRQYSRVAIGIGGTHYSEKFNELIMESDVALGHIIPKYALDNFDARMLAQAVSKCTRGVSLAALDWKGLGKNKQAIIGSVKDSGLEILEL